MVQYSNLDNVEKEEQTTSQKTGKTYKFALESPMSRGKLLKNVSFALLAASVIIFSIKACTNAYAQTSDVSAQTVRWEYKVLDYTWWGYKSTETSLNKFGNEGWELVSFSCKQSDSTKYIYILKRRLPIGSFSDNLNDN